MHPSVYHSYTKSRTDMAAPTTIAKDFGANTHAPTIIAMTDAVVDRKKEML